MHAEPGPQTAPWIERYEQCMWNTFGRRRLVAVRGRGTRLWDAEGREYLDFLTGIAVNSLGHCHPAVTEAIQRQAAELVHCTNLYYIPAQIEWAELLLEHAFPGRVFFANSGAEANEGMLKVARRYANRFFEPERRTVLAFHNSFHGRTLATLSATGQAKVQQGFEPLVPGYRHVDYNDPEALRAAIDETVAAILVEPVQGEGGVLPATADFMRTLDELRREHGLLLLFDEVQSGLGRAGADYAYQIHGVQPDAMSLAKPLAGGLAAGAVLASERLAEVMEPGSHGSTQAGNPLAAAAGLAFCRVLFGEGLPQRAATLGAKILEELKSWAGKVPGVTGARGQGLMLGLLLEGPGADIVLRCEEAGLLINCTAGNVIRMLPPLNVEESDVELALGILRRSLEAAHGG